MGPRAEGEPPRKKKAWKGSSLEVLCSGLVGGREVGWVSPAMAPQPLGKQEATLWGTNQVQAGQLMARPVNKQRRLELLSPSSYRLSPDRPVN